uniref:Cytochrome c oxidase assembly factor 5 n=1 Tax=Ditylum brightwellii TaxID=49249 RepID=A0A7S4T3P2_9STRA
MMFSTFSLSPLMFRLPSHTSIRLKKSSTPPHPSKKPKKKCAEAALSLLTCMEETPCVKSGRSVKECLKDPIESDDCRAVRNAYYTCKHSQLNMRTRIRGVRVY